MKMSDKLYNVLKWICLTALPALTTLYGVIGTTLHIPYTQETITILVAVDTCLGTMIGVSTANYYKHISDNPDMDKVMAAVEKWFSEHEAKASDFNIDVPED